MSGLAVSGGGSAVVGGGGAAVVGGWTVDGGATAVVGRWAVDCAGSSAVVGGRFVCRVAVEGAVAWTVDGCDTGGGWRHVGDRGGDAVTRGKMVGSVVCTAAEERADCCCCTAAVSENCCAADRAAGGGTVVDVFALAGTWDMGGGGAPVGTATEVSTAN